jgi:hypothetical protein
MTSNGTEVEGDTMANEGTTKANDRDRPAKTEPVNQQAPQPKPKPAIEAGQPAPGRKPLFRS